MQPYVLRVLGVAVVLAAAASPASSQQAALAISGDPQPLIVRVALPGFAPEPARDEGTLYSVSAGEVVQVVAQLDAPMPPGVTLLVQLEPPPGATGTDAVVLSTVPQAVVLSIPPGTYSLLGVVYELRATVAAGVVPMNSRQIVFTLTAGT